MRVVTFLVLGLWGSTSFPKSTVFCALQCLNMSQQWTCLLLISLFQAISIHLSKGTWVILLNNCPTSIFYLKMWNKCLLCLILQSFILFQFGPIDLIYWQLCFKYTTAHTWKNWQDPFNSVPELTARGRKRSALQRPSYVLPLVETGFYSLGPWQR